MIPYFIAGLSVLIAVISHWKLPKEFWKATWISTLGIVVVSILLFLVFQFSFLGLDKDASLNGNPSGLMLLIGGLVLFFGLLISIFVGYLVNIIKPTN